MGIRRKSSEERIEAGHQEEVLRLGIRRKPSFQGKERIQAGH